MADSNLINAIRIKVGSHIKIVKTTSGGLLIWPFANNAAEIPYPVPR